jgi:hypothetical protein
MSTESCDVELLAQTRGTLVCRSRRTAERERFSTSTVRAHALLSEATFGQCQPPRLIQLGGSEPAHGRRPLLVHTSATSCATVSARTDSNAPLPSLPNASFLAWHIAVVGCQRIRKDSTARMLCRVRGICYGAGFQAQAYRAGFVPVPPRCRFRRQDAAVYGS